MVDVKLLTGLQKIRRFRSNRRLVSPTDKRSPMLRLLQDCNNASSGMIEVDYAQQWSTLFKAEKLGYVDDHHRLTAEGRKWLEAQNAK